MSQGAEMFLNRDAKDAISGFYYDQQLENRNLIMSLHPNMVLTDIAPEYWTEVTQDKWSDGYQITPIAKCIIPEDFQIGVSNTWQDQSLGTDIENLWGQVKSVAPYAKYASEKATEAYDNGQAEAQKSSGAKFANDIMGAAGIYIDKATDYLNRALVVQGSRFSYYNGTGVAFGNMTMKFTLFSDWNLEGKFESCVTKIEKLLPYAVGKYVTWDGKEDGTTKEKDSKASEWNQFLGWQIPPGGFKADVQSIDNIQKGTLKLVIGTMYSIANLVIQDIQFNFSKQVMKEPQADRINTHPMYCDVQLTLKPASKYTDKSLLRAMKGEDTERYRLDEINRINKRLSIINKNLNK